MASALFGSRLKKFWQTFVNSIYSPPFYASIPSQTTGAALSYFMKLAVVLAVISLVGAYGFWAQVVKFERNLPSLVTSLSNNFPADLAITIKGGEASVNVPQPYFIPQKELKSGDPNLQHILVIDTKTPFSAQQFARYKSYAWLTRDALVYYGQYDSQAQTSDGRPAGSGAGNVTASEIRVMPLTNVADTTIDHARVYGLLTKLEPWVRVLTPFFVVAVVGFIYVAMLFKLVYLFVLAMLVWLVATLLRYRYSYGVSYRLALYGASLGFVLSGLAELVKFHVPTFSVTVLSLGIVTVNLVAGRRSRSGTASRPR